MFYVFAGKTCAEAKSEAACCSTAEDIIELQDVRMSPIASLRNRQYTNALHATGADGLDFAKFPPSFRIARNYGSTRCGVRYRGNKGLYIHAHTQAHINSLPIIPNFICRFMFRQQQSILIIGRKCSMPFVAVPPC